MCCASIPDQSDHTSTLHAKIESFKAQVILSRVHIRLKHNLVILTTHQSSTTDRNTLTKDKLESGQGQNWLKRSLQHCIVLELKHTARQCRSVTVFQLRSLGREGGLGAGCTIIVRPKMHLIQLALMDIHSLPLTANNTLSKPYIHTNGIK